MTMVVRFLGIASIVVAVAMLESVANAFVVVQHPPSRQQTIGLAAHHEGHRGNEARNALTSSWKRFSIAAFSAGAAAALAFIPVSPSSAVRA